MSAASAADTRSAFTMAWNRRSLWAEYAELRGLPCLPIVQLDRRLEKLRIVDTPAWSKAHQREAIILDALQGDGSTTTRVDAAAKILGVSARTVRRCRHHISLSPE